jgi:hypothetical protein
MPFPPEIRTDGTEEIHLARTWFPGVVDRKAAQRVEVAPGAEIQGVDIRMVRTPFVTISGKVIGLPAGARANVQLGIADGYAGMNNNSGMVHKDGTFQISRADPGKYVLTANVFNQGGPNGGNLQSAAVEIEVSNLDVPNIELRLMPPFDVPAQLSFDDAAAREAQTPPARPGQQPQRSNAPQPARQRRIMAFPADPGMSYGMHNTQFDVGENDSFTMERMQPGRYRLSTSWGAYVKAVRVGTNEVEGSILDCRYGFPGPVTVVLTSKFGEVSGVVNGAGAGVSVSLFTGSSNFGANAYNFLTEQGGAYHFSRVPPGKYRLVAGEADFVHEVQQSHDEDDYKDVVETIEVRPGDKIIKDLTKK